MPTPSTSELPKPRSWDEFEDIVWDLYSREWQDRDAQRYGRSGQPQQGVDIYGRPSRLGGQYAGIQCKRYEAGNLNRKTVEAEIAKAEQFQPPLAEYLIATTEPRDAPLQEIVRLIDGERRAKGRFSVRIVFWDDLCSQLAHPDNDDLLRKHYGGWLAGGQVTGVKIGMIQAGTVIVQSQVRNQPPAAESPTRKNAPKPPPLSLGERNHLLISLDTPFKHAIWEELLHNKETLNIGSVPDFRKDNSFGQYKRYMMPSLAVTRFTNRLPA